MDLLEHFHFTGFRDRRKTLRAGGPSEELTKGEERPAFVGWIPVVVPLAAVVLAALIYYIFWASWSY